MLRFVVITEKKKTGKTVQPTLHKGRFPLEVNSHTCAIFWPTAVSVGRLSGDFAQLLLNLK